MPSKVALIYCRVSTREQIKNFSLPTQREGCINDCKRERNVVDRIFIEKGQSAKTTDRPVLQEMLQYCRKNKARIDYVVVYALSRLSRQTHDHQVLKAYLARYGIKIRSVTEPFDDSSAGRLMENMLASFSQFENDLKAESTTRGMKAALKEGMWPFRPPLGYVKELVGAKRSQVVLDSDRAPLISNALEMYASGTYTKNEVLRAVTKQGLRMQNGTPVSTQTFDKMLRNPFYAGWLLVRGWGEPVRGSHQPLVPQSIFDKVQHVMKRRKSTGRRAINNPDFPLRHFAKCGECSEFLTGSWSKGRKKRYAYYGCRKCERVNIPKKKLEKAFLKLLEELQPRPEYLRLFKAVVLDVWKDKTIDARKLHDLSQKEIDRLHERKQKLIDAFVFDQTIDKATYGEQLDRLSEEVTLAELELGEATTEELDVSAALTLAEQLISDVSGFWISASLDQKQRLQQVLFPSGIEYGEGRFRTTETCLLFNILAAREPSRSDLVAPRGIEPLFYG